jgi:hypothetical protein
MADDLKALPPSWLFCLEILLLEALDNLRLIRRGTTT